MGDRVVVVMAAEVVVVVLFSLIHPGTDRARAGNAVCTTFLGRHASERGHSLAMIPTLAPTGDCGWDAVHAKSALDGERCGGFN